jgi:hypothetical protein
VIIRVRGKNGKLTVTGEPESSDDQVRSLRQAYHAALAHCAESVEGSSRKMMVSINLPGGKLASDGVKYLFLGAQLGCLFGSETSLLEEVLKQSAAVFTENGGRFPEDGFDLCIRP